MRIPKQQNDYNHTPVKLDPPPRSQDPATITQNQFLPQLHVRTRRPSHTSHEPRHLETQCSHKSTIPRPSVHYSNTFC
jgi:hypothetical protein